MDKIKLALLKSQLIAAEATFEEEPTLKNELRYERAEQKFLKDSAQRYITHIPTAAMSGGRTKYRTA